MSLQFSFGQSNYLSGNIITLEGDTLQGIIDYRDWNTSPKKVLFKKDKSSQNQSYGPSEISSFKVNKQHYISAVIDTEISQTIDDKLDTSHELNIKKISSFVKVIFDGEKKLYHYKSDEYKKDNFYISINNNLELLIYKKYINEVDQKNSIVENKKYIGQLSFYLDGCSEVQSELKKTKYTESSLEEIFNTFYDCGEEEFVFKSNPKTVGLKLGVLAGLSNTSLSFSSSFKSFLTETEYSQSTNFVGGVFFDIILPRSFERYSIYNELSYTSYSVEGKHTGEIRGTHSKFGNQAIGINSMFRYKHPIGNQFIFVNAGINLSFVVNEINEMDQTILSAPEIPKAIEEAHYDTRKSEQGLLFGVGVKHQDFALEVRYMIGNGMANYGSTTSITHRIFFLLSYELY